MPERVLKGDALKAWGYERAHRLEESVETLSGSIRRDIIASHFAEAYMRGAIDAVTDEVEYLMAKGIRK